VVRGKIDFIGFIRGRDDELVLSLLARYSKCDPVAKIRPVVTGAQTSDKVLAQAIWLLESEDEMFQATAFAVEGLGMLTASHAIEQKTFASRPPHDYKKYEVEVLAKDDHTDIARIKIDGRMPVQLPIELSNSVQQGDDITLLGFPHYHVGDSVQIDRGSVTQSKMYFGIKHFISSCTIIKGNSGGSVLNAINKVVGIAVKGLGTKGKFSDKDELSSFVPIDLAKGL
jgi:S1-C subfamily serine protease